MRPPEKNPDRISERMDALRRSLRDDVAEIATGVRTKSDWRYYVQSYPWLTAGAAAAVGYLLVPAPVKKVKHVVPKADALEEIAEQEKLVLAPEAEATPQKGIAASLMAFALAAGSRAAMGYLSNRLGGVIEQATTSGTKRTAEETFAAAEKKPK